MTFNYMHIPVRTTNQGHLSLNFISLSVGLLIRSNSHVGKDCSF